MSSSSLNIGKVSAIPVDSLQDVTITSVADNEVLAYDSGSGLWINQTAAEAGLVETSDAATSSSSGIVELATSTETTTGTDAARALTPDGLAGSDFGKTVVTILVTDPNGDALTTGDGKAYWRVPSTINAYNLVDCAAAVTTASTSGTPEVQLHNLTKGLDMLSTTITIDINELDSKDDSDSLPVINTANDHVSTGDLIRIDVDTAGTGTKGLMVEMQFQLP